MSPLTSPVRRATPVAVVMVAVTVALAACSGGGGVGAGAGGPTPAPRSAGPSPTDPYAQPFTNGAPCPKAVAPGLPANAGCVSSVVADLDGNGEPDRFVVFASIDSAWMPTQWSATAILDSGKVLAPVPVPSGPQASGDAEIYPLVVGAADADGDGRAEVFVKLTGIVYHAAVPHIAGIFHVVHDTVRQVRVRGDGPFEFFTGGTSRRGQGAVCATVAGRPVLLVRLIEVVPPERWRWTQRTYWWRDGALVPGAIQRGFYPQSVSIADPRVTAFYALRCGSAYLE